MVATIIKPQEQHFQLHGVDWEFYEGLLELVGDRHVFVTYDKGSLEIMSPSWKHEHHADLLGFFVRLLAVEFKVPLIGGGSTTFKLQRADAGLEPDRCFYLKHASLVLGKEELDLGIDPPPDLAIEIEMSRRLANRIDIYRRLRIPELWCYDGKRLRFLHLGADAFAESERSLSFPQLRSADIHPLLEKSWDMDETQWTEFVRNWIRETLLPR